MGIQVSRDPESEGSGILAACLSDREAILESSDSLRPGSTYLLCFGKRFSRLVVRAYVRYCRLVPGTPRHFEIGLFLPLTADGERLAALNRSSLEPLPLVGHPRLVSGSDDEDAAIAIPVASSRLISRTA
jgi:hypothetical protein